MRCSEVTRTARPLFSTAMLYPYQKKIFVVVVNVSVSLVTF